MTVQIRGTGTIGSASISPRSINSVAGTQAGDIVLLQVQLSSNTAPTSLPDGFVLVTDGTTSAEITGTSNNRIYLKIATGSEPDTYSVGFSASTNCSLGLLVIYSDSAAEIDVGAVAVQATTSSTDRVWASVNTVAGAFLAFFANHTNNFSSTPPDGTTERYDTGGSSRLYLMTETAASTGATGTRTATGSSTSSRCITIAFVEEVGPQPPAAPSGLTATAASPSHINLDWTDNSGNETGFEIQQSPDGSDWTLIHTTAVDTTSYNVTGLDEYTLYYFRVRAVNGDGESAYTSAANARTHIAAPTSLAATTIDHQSIALTWEDNSAVDDGYKVEQSPNGSDWTQIHTTAADAISYNVTGLSPNTEYYFRVRAFVGGDNSAYSNTDNALTDLAPLVAPTDLVAAPVLSDKIRLTWADTNADEDSFDIGRSPNGTTGWVIIDTATDTTYDDDELSPETTYYYRVRAVRGVETTAWSNVSSATTYAALTEPYDLITTVAGARQVNLSWDSDDTDRTGFVIESSTDGENWTEVGETPSTSFQVTGLDPETTYTFRVRSYREAA